MLGRVESRQRESRKFPSGQHGAQVRAGMTGLAKKFDLWKNSNEHFGQPAQSYISILERRRASQVAQS